MPNTATPETTSLSSAQLAPISQVATQAAAEASAKASVAGEAHFESAGGKPADESELAPLQSLVKTAGAKAAAVPTQLGPFNTGYIAFNNGVPVGSPNCSLTLHQNGSYTFQGHFHDSGATSYNGQFAWVITTGKGVAFAFSQNGHMAGTFASGSRNWDFNVNGTNPAIAANWNDLCASYHWRWQASVNLDIGSLLNSIVQALTTAIGIAVKVISVVS